MLSWGNIEAAGRDLISQRCGGRITEAVHHLFAAHNPGGRCRSSGVRRDAWIRRQGFVGSDEQLTPVPF